MIAELKHHFGGQAYYVPAGTLEETDYLAVRESHGFLPDANHSHQAGEREIRWGGQSRLLNSIRVYRAGDAPESIARALLQTDYWLAVEYRAPATAST
jgi:hypothetical protein